MFLKTKKKLLNLGTSVNEEELVLFLKVNRNIDFRKTRG